MLHFATKNATVKLLCVMVAAILWAQAAANQEIEKVMPLPLEVVGLPDSLVVRGLELPEEVWVRIRSNKLHLFVSDMFHRDRGRVEISLAGARGGSFRHNVSTRDVVVDATPVAVEPPVNLDVRVYRQLRRQVPVRVVTEGQLPEGITLAGRPSVVPDVVQVSGPEPLVQSLDHVNTQPVSIHRRRRSFTEMVDLVVPDPDLGLRPVEVEVSLGVDDILERTFLNVPISILSDLDSTKIYVDPNFAQVRIKGPGHAVAALAPQDVAVVIHVGEQGVGVYQMEPEIVVPEGLFSLAVDPPSFQVIVGRRGGDAVSGDQGGNR